MLAGSLPMLLLRTVSELGKLADRTSVLDEWPDDERRTLVTLYALDGELREQGFMAVASNAAGRTVAERIFMFNHEGLRALTPPEAQRLVPRPGLRRRLRSVLSVLALGLLFVGCGSTGPTVSPAGGSPTAFEVNGCPVVAPKTLPSGAPAGEPVTAADGRIAWGAGTDLVIEAIGQLALGDPDTLGVPPDSDQRVEIRGNPGVVLPIGDEGVGEIAIVWEAGSCRYTIWLAPGERLKEAITYAASL